MHPSSWPIAIAATAILSSCAAFGTQPSVRPPIVPSGAQAGRVHPAWWREAPATVREGVYVSDFIGSQRNVILAFGPQNRKNKLPECTIPGQMDVFDIASDTSSNVYVPTFAGGNNIVNVYKPGCGTLIATVNDPYGNPSGAAVRDTTFYVQDLDGSVPVCTLSGCSSELTNPSIQSGEGGSVAIDSAGNVWAADYDKSFGIMLIVWPHAKMPGHIVSGYVNTVNPGGILFDKDGTLISVDSAAVRTYACKVRRAKCKSTGSFPLKGTSAFGALNRRNTDFQVTDSQNASVDVYAYPGFAYQYSYDRGPSGTLNPSGITQTR